jgi:hypothetical protein
MTRKQLLKYIESYDTLDNNSLVKLEELNSEYPYFNISRLLYLLNLKNLNDKRYDKTLNTTAAYLANRNQLKELISSYENNPESPNEQFRNLIDKFIKEEPSISKSTDKDYSSFEIHENDDSQLFDIATETLANIYWKQGNKKKSIKIYKELMLKFPEKSSYFAAQIEKIKKEETNN